MIRILTIASISLTLACLCSPAVAAVTVQHNCLIGDAGPNTITDTQGYNCLRGLNGTDTLRGQGGNDAVDAAGDVTKDTVYGGSGTDIFMVSGVSKSNADVIKDFAAGETVCPSWAFTSWSLTSGTNRYLVVISSGDPKYVAYIPNLGSKKINVKKCRLTLDAAGSRWRVVY